MIRKSVIIELKGMDTETLHRYIHEGIKEFIIPDNKVELHDHSLKIYQRKDGEIYLDNRVAGVYMDIKDGNELEKLNNFDNDVMLLLSFPDVKNLAAEKIKATLSNKKVVPVAYTIEELELYFNVLESGFDHVVFVADGYSEKHLNFIRKLNKVDKIELIERKVVKIKWLGMGERVCIDFVNRLHPGDGCLIGNFSRELYLVGPEIYENSFAPPRIFRVNSGAIHSYSLLPDGRTAYLSELRSGDSLAVANIDGTVRQEIIGRVKREFRSLIMVITEGDNAENSVILQNAESVYLYGRSKHIFVNHLKTGDLILAYKLNMPRHMGIPVNEGISEV